MFAADTESDIRPGLAAQLARHINQAANADLIQTGKRIVFVDLIRVVGVEELTGIVAAET